MKVAIVHFALLYMSGAEKVLEALCELYPEADIFTHVYDPSKVSERINNHRVKTTFIQKLPGAHKHYKSYLPLMPYALEQLDLSGYDLIISGESGPTKGVVPPPDSLHVCYCHSPMRYVWDMNHEYTDRKSALLKPFYAYFIHKLKIWDYTTAGRVDLFIANSSFVQKRIKKYYRREALVLSPPVDADEFEIAGRTGDFYLWLGRFVDYKRADLAIHAFNKLKKKLVMIGSSEASSSFREMAGDNIEILGFQPFQEIKAKLSQCKALIFPGIEDAGIVPIEAMASGRPVIAYNKGGLKDTVKEGLTGIFFDEQTPESLEEAVLRFEEQEDMFDPSAIKAHAAAYNKESFKNRFKEIVEGALTSGE